MSTPSRSASSATRSAGRTLKPMMIALSTVARLTSFCVIAPTPRWMIRRSTSSPTSILSSASSSASTEPDTSPLRMRLRVSTLPAARASLRSSSEMRLRRLARLAARDAASRRSAIWRAVRSSGATRNVSPAPGTDVRPRTMTGRDGPACSTLLPCSSSMARTRPWPLPATIESPTLSVPDWTRTVATGPRPLSRCASMATPRASLSGLARRSRAASAVSRTASRSPSMFVPFLAETSTNIVSPPYSSAMRLYSVSCWRILAGLASGLSTLLTATTIGTHGREGLVTGGVDERDGALLALVRRGDLVGTDVLGDATGLALGDLLGADRVEELRLSVVDVAHDGHDRRTRLEVLVLLGLELLVEGLRGRGHLAEVEQHGDERRRVGVDLVGEVGQRGTTTNADGRLAVATGDADATQARRLHLLELLALRALGLAASDRTTAAATEGTSRRATTATATARTAEATGATATGGAAGATTEATTATGATRAATAGAAGRALAGTADGAALGHHARAGTRTTGTRGAAGSTRTTACGGSTGTRGATGSTRTLATLTALTALALLRTRHALARAERVVARTRRGVATGTRGAGLAHALARGERVVPRTRLTRTGGRTRGGRDAGGLLTTVTAGLHPSGSRRRRSGGGRSSRGRSLRCRGGGCGSCFGGGRSGLAGSRCCGSSRGGSRRCCGCGGGRRGGRRRRSSLLGRGGGRAGGGGFGGRRLLVAAGRAFPGEGLDDLADDGGLDGRRCRPDELSLALQVCEQCLALDSELLCELVDPDLSHISPVPGPA